MFPLLEIKDLNISFLEEGMSTLALNDISLTVTKGKITAIVGESGSGKSVTALSILQLLPKQAAIKGKILFSRYGSKQEDLIRLNSKDISTIRGNHIAMVFQEPMTSLNPVLTCGFQVMETLTRHHKLSWKKQKKKQSVCLSRWNCRNLHLCLPVTHTKSVAGKSNG